MIKPLLYSFIVLLIGFNAYSSGGPIVPWPLDANRQDISVEDIEGSWAAQKDSSRICLEVGESGSELSFVQLAMTNNANAVIRFSGGLKFDDRVFVGEIEDKSQRQLAMTIYRSKNSMVLRLGQTASNFEEYKLRKIQSCRFKE